jgi:hypothetical protein
MISYRSLANTVLPDGETAVPFSRNARTDTQSRGRLPLPVENDSHATMMLCARNLQRLADNERILIETQATDSAFHPTQWPFKTTKEIGRSNHG